MSYYGPDAERYYDAQRERAEAEWDAYVAWCEDRDLDPDEDHDEEWQDYNADCEEDAMLARHEAMMEDRMADYERYGDE